MIGWIGMGLSFAYIVTALAGIFVSGLSATVSYRRLIWAVRLDNAALAFAVLNLGIYTARIPSLGVIWPVVWFAISISALITAHFARVRRDLKARELALNSYWH
jgi:hypothetical protein